MDLLRTQQIIINLVSNAIKFSPEGSKVLIKINLLKNRTRKQYKTQISVIDSGIGMSQ